MTHRSVALLAALALGLSLAPGLAAPADCMPRSSCPMMGAAKGTGHCQPSDSLVADCCAMKAPPVDNTRAARATVGKISEAMTATPTPQRVSVEQPVAGAAELSPLAGKLHTIGRHTLFQSFLS